MQNKIKYLSIFFAISSIAIFIFAFLTSPASATDDRLGSIYIDFTQCQEDLTNVECSLYQITTINALGVQTLNEEYSSINVDFDKLTNASYWKSFSENLENYINFYLIPADLEFVTDENGQYQLSDLEWGIYYIQMDTVYLDDCDCYCEPTLIMIGSAGTSDSDINDDFTVVPKIAVISDEPEEPEEPEYPDDPEEPSDPDEPDVPVITELKYTLTVKKVWENTNSDAVILDVIEVEIRCNGETYEIIELSEQNAWSYTWTYSDITNVWSVKELTKIENFSTNYTSEMFTFTITNTYEDTFEEELIITGYYGYLVPVFASVGVICILLGLILRVKSNKGRVKGERLC